MLNLKNIRTKMAIKKCIKNCREGLETAKIKYEVYKMYLINGHQGYTDDELYRLSGVAHSWYRRLREAEDALENINKRS